MKGLKVFSGIQPSGNLHIGNYLGAIKQFVELQKENEAIFCVVDEHAITVPQDPEKLREKTLEVAMIYLAAGIDPEKSIVFIQSHVPAHAELGWILNTLTPLGELERMTQFKEKKQERKGTMAGILNYPTLMAADILLYKTEAVPVGEDQIQHIEFTRMIAEKFNNRFGDTFAIPKPLVDKNTARIMALDDPSKKMSKSAISEHSYISLLDKPETIQHKIKIAVTDSQTEIGFDPAGRPAISNLLNIYSAFYNEPTDKIEKKYSGKGYAEFKKDLAEVIIEGLSHLQHKFSELSKDKDGVLEILRKGAVRAENISSKTLQEVKEKIGFYR
ncbi:MAG: tryptophan--tRNA ligase [bacterium]|nr:tryptophan--tRNA ligase [bacterium]